MPKNRIIKNNDDRYSYFVSDKSGKRLQIRSRKNETLKEFRVRCDKLDQKAEGVSIDDTFDALFRRWIDEHVKLNLSVSEMRTTPPIYRLYVKPYLGHRRLSDITRSDVYSVLARAAKKGLAPSYVKKIRGVISRPYNWAINTLGYELISPTQGLIFRMPGDDRRGNKRGRVINDEDMERILEAAKRSKYCNYFRVLAMTGLRPSECLGLQIRDIKDDHLEIRRGITIDGPSDLKTSAARREIPINDELRQVLAEQREKAVFKTSEGWLFPTVDGRPSMNSIQCAFKKILRQTGSWEWGGLRNRTKVKMLRKPVDCSLYDFRHTFATRMAKRGMPHVVLQAIMGHTDIAITLQYYVDVTPEQMAAAAEMMVL